jgi:hypothetical protein
MATTHTLCGHTLDLSISIEDALFPHGVPTKTVKDPLAATILIIINAFTFIHT